MAATGVQVNWSAVAHGGNAITKVTNCAFDEGGNLIYFSGDTNIYNIVAAIAVNMPTASVTSGDVATVMSFAVGLMATLTATLKDARGQVGGDILFSMVNAVVQSPSMSAAHAAFGTATINFAGISPDGQTNPLSFTRA